jgi:hypothetical protein
VRNENGAHAANPHDPAPTQSLVRVVKKSEEDGRHGMKRFHLLIATGRESEKCLRASNTRTLR